MKCRARCEAACNNVPCSNYEFDVLRSLYTHATKMQVQEAQTAQGNTNLLTRKACQVCPVCITSSMIMYCQPA